MRQTTPNPSKYVVKTFCLFHGAFMVLLFSFLKILPVQAQFTDNPEINTPIVTTQGEQAQPKITANPNGGFYVSWFDNSSGGYDVFLQRLDADGNRLWDEAGLLVADRNYSSTVDYGIDSDASGNVYLTFRDDRNGGEKITVTKIAPDGSFPWGAGGVQVSDGSGFLANPGVAAASDGSTVVAWFEDSFVNVVSLDEEGNVQWQKTITDLLGLTTSDIVASDAPESTGEVILLMRTFGGFTTPGQLRAQKLDANGDALWGDNPVSIMTSGSLQFGNFPTFISDGSGGMVVAWYQSAPSLQTYVQRVDASGTEQFQSGGLPLSLNGSQLRVAPSAAFDPSQERTYVFWVELNGNQSLNGIYGQQVDVAGNRVWGDNGLEVIPLGSQDLQQVEAGLLEGEPTVSYVNQSAPSLQTARLTPGGSFAWSEEFVYLSGNGFGRLQKHTPSELEHILVWQAATDSDIYAQNINFEGRLGIFDSGDTNVDLSVSYNPAWNLVSLPVEEMDVDPQTAFPASVPGSLFLYNGSYSQESLLQPATGYWLNFSESSTADFTGEPVAQSARTLISGWNLIGGASSPTQISDPGEITVPGTTYGFNGNYVATETLEPGYAYWVRTIEEGSVDLISAGQSIRADLQRQAESELNDMYLTFDRFIIQSASSQMASSRTVSSRTVSSRTASGFGVDLGNVTSVNRESGSGDRLLLFNGKVPMHLNPLRFSLPPVPPGGAADIRFAGNSWLIEEASGIIQLQGFGKGSILTYVPKTDASADHHHFEGVTGDAGTDTPESEESFGANDNAGYPFSHGMNQMETGYLLTFVSADGVPFETTLVREGDRTEIPAGAVEIRFRKEVTPMEHQKIVELLPNVPNPFNPSTLISFRLNEQASVTLDVYSLTGQHIKTLVNGEVQQGSHSVRFDASDLASGVYLYRLQAAGDVVTRKMILIE